MGRRGRHADPNSKQSKAALARAAALGVPVEGAGQARAPSPTPAMPADVKARPLAAALWKAHADTLAAAGRLRPEHADSFALLCHLHDNCHQLREQLAAEGWITATKSGQAASPVAKLLRDARRDFVQLAREFGLTPAAETRFPPEGKNDGEEEDDDKKALRAFGLTG